MRIILLECKKALSSPIMIALLLLFSFYNLFLIYTYADHRDELTVVNELVDSYGHEITAESLQQLELDLQQELTSLNDRTAKEIGQTFASANEFFEQLSYEDERLFNEEEWRSLRYLQLKELYFLIGQGIDEEYETIDVKKIAQFEIEQSGLSGKAAEALKKEYDTFSERFEEMKANGEHKQWFFIGKQYMMHSFLFRTIVKHLMFEALILTVLATALITNFEFEQRTHLVSYTTWRGRRLKKDKLLASLISSTAMTMLLVVITLGAYFTCFDYSNMWGSSISSAFNWEYKFPYVTWWEMSFLTYVLLAILLIFMCMPLFTTLTFGVAIWTKNSYLTFLLFAIFFGIAIILPDFVPTTSNFIYLSGFSLPWLMMNPHAWFMGFGGLTMFKYYELTTVLIGIAMAMTVYLFSINRFKKEEIH